MQGNIVLKSGDRFVVINQDGICIHIADTREECAQFAYKQEKFWFQLEDDFQYEPATEKVLKYNVINNESVVDRIDAIDLIVLNHPALDPKDVGEGSEEPVEYTFE